MFSCCRANPKVSKKSNKQKDNETNIVNEEQNDINQEKSDTTKSDNKTLIIPTITVENGKTVTDTLKDTEQCNTEEVGIKNENNAFKENENITTSEIIEQIQLDKDVINEDPKTLETREITLVDNSRIEETNGIVIIFYISFNFYFLYSLI